MNLVSIGVGVILAIIVIGFFVATWKAGQDWRWYNLVAGIFIMLLAVTFLFPTAGVLKSRSAWYKMIDDLEKRADQAAAEHRELKFGDPNIPQSGVIPLSQELNRIGLEAGRSWRSLEKQSVNENGVTLAKPTAGGIGGGASPADDGAATEANIVPEGLVVYAFLEAPDPNQIMLPMVYLGEFVVTASSADQVTLVPTGPLEPTPAEIVNQQQAQSWSLHELLPIDSHETFIAEGSQPTPDNFLGRVDEARVRQLLGDNVLPETLQSYLDDGRRATSDDPPLTRWTRIEFDAPTSIPVDNPDEREALDGGYFDGSGRAVDKRLHHGGEGKVEFKKGDQIVVKDEVARRMSSEGVAHPVDQYYLRPLNDYRFSLRRVRMRLNELEDRKQQLNEERQLLDEAIAKTGDMLVVNQVDSEKLEQDLHQFSLETRALESYSSGLRQELSSMQAEMARLHRKNLGLEQQIKSRHGVLESTGAVSSPSSPSDASRQ